MKDLYVVLNAISDYWKKQLPLLSLSNHTLSIDSKAGPEVVRIESMAMVPADGKTWEEILEPLGAKKRSYEFAIMFPDQTWRMSAKILAYSDREAEAILKDILETAQTSVSGILLMREEEEL